LGIPANNMAKILLVLAALIVGGLFVIFLLMTPKQTLDISKESLKEGRKGSTQETIINDRTQSPEIGKINEINDEPTSNTKNALVAADQILIKGKVIVEDKFGVFHNECNGRFQLLQLWKGNWKAQTVELKNGQFRALLKKDAEFKLQSGRFDRKKAEFRKQELKYTADSTRVLELHAVWRRSTVLYIKAEDTRMNLSQLEVRKYLGVSSTYHKHPDQIESTRLVMSSGRSPLILPALDHSDETLFVRSPGHSWNSILLDVMGGTRVLILKPGGVLNVTLVGDSLPDDAVLRLFDKDSSFKDPPYGEFEIHNQRSLIIQSIAHGEYIVRVENGAWNVHRQFCVKSKEGVLSFRPTKQFGEAVVRIEPGLTTNTVIKLTDPQEVERAPLRGEVLLPVEWEQPKFTLNLRNVGNVKGEVEEITILHRGMENHESAPGVYHWDAGKAPLGKYQLQIRPINYGLVFTVPKEGLTDLHIQIPLPCHVSLRVIDTASGKDADINNIYSEMKQFSLGWDTLFKNPETGFYEFKSAQGEIIFHLRNTAYSVAESNTNLFSILPGRNDFKLNVSRSCGVKLCFVDQSTNTIIPYDDKWKVKLIQVDGEGESNFRRYYGGQYKGVLVRVSNPGRYKIHLPKIPGYLPLECQEVVIEPGGYVDHIIYLQLIR